ncbi:MAG: type 2 isopentenyl-diphosphate Delta-isomerase [Bacillota bacterium]
MSRSERKTDHIRLALETGQLRKTGLDDITFVHQSIPESSLNSINLKTEIGELVLSSPIFINAMTGGGGEKTLEINRNLAQVAKETDIGIAVGSQMSALRNQEERRTFEVVRKEYPNGTIFANLGSEADVGQAKAAVEMVQADALQIHLNVVQELAMPEGDRDFRGMLLRIDKIVNEVNVPIIVKETGFGMGQETIEKLFSLGVSAIDVGGFGGTNFAAIENQRRLTKLSFFEGWGIPTAVSIAEARHMSPTHPIIASGGIQTSLDIAKGIALGANAVALAGYILKILTDSGPEKLVEEINMMKQELTMIMTALGTNTVKELHDTPLIISGETWHWLTQRGIDTKKYSIRKK